MTTVSIEPRTLIDAAVEQDRTALLEHESYALLEASGIRVPKHCFVPVGEDITASQLSEIQSQRVVVKVVSADIIHKTEVGGVVIVERDPARLKHAMHDMRENVRRLAPTARLEGFLIVEEVQFRSNTPGAEYLLSLRRDPAFGACIVFGAGGVLTEWYGALSATTRVLLPVASFDENVALETIAATPFGKLALAPSRLHAEPPVEHQALIAALRALVHAAALEGASARIEEIEINPIAATTGGFMALDAFIRLGPQSKAARPPRPIDKIKQLLHPKSVAVIGASSRSVNAGRIILRNLRTAAGPDYGRLYAVHPHAERIDGIPCVPRVEDLCETVDLAVVSVPAEAAAETISSLTEARKAHSIILIPGGFAETGHRALAERIETTLTESRQRDDRGPIMVGGNCLGVVSKREYNTFFLPTYKLPFHDAPGENLVAVGQSGAYLVSFTSNLDGIIFPRASISYGNEMDLTAADFLEYYLEHEAGARVFAFYLEGFQAGEGERLASLIRDATSSGRPVIVYKAGRTEQGAKAAASHTASMAGDYEVAAAVLGQAGAMIARTLNMFEDYTKIFTMLDGKQIVDRRIGVITNAGFEAGAISDHLHTLTLQNFEEETRTQLRGILPAIAHVDNPVDTTPMTNTSSFISAVEAIAGDPTVDMLVISAIPAAPSLDLLPPDPVGAHSENIFQAGSMPTELNRLQRTLDKPIVVSIDSGRLYDPTVLHLQRSGIPVYRKIDRASRALSAFATFHLDVRGGQT